MGGPMMGGPMGMGGGPMGGGPMGGMGMGYMPPLPPGDPPPSGDAMKRARMMM